MSRRSLIFELTRGRWYYAVIRYDEPLQSHNWIDRSIVVGPFDSETQTEDHLLTEYHDAGWTVDELREPFRHALRERSHVRRIFLTSLASRAHRPPERK
jgi:hypothetical protein